MAKACIDIDGLSNSQVKVVAKIVEDALHKHWPKDDLEVELVDEELDEEEEKDEEE